MAKVNTRGGDFDFSSNAFVEGWSGPAQGTDGQSFDAGNALRQQQSFEYTPSSSQEIAHEGPAYVGQDFDLGSNVSMSMGEMSARRADAATQQRQQPQQPQPRPQQPATQQVQPTMVTPQQQSTPPQQVGAQESQQAAGDTQAKLDRQLIELTQNGIPDVESSRMMTQDFDEAVESNVQAEAAERMALAREGSALEQPRQGSREYEARRRANEVGNAADRAVAMEDEAAGQGERPWWANPVQRILRFSQGMEIRPREIIDSMKNKAARAFKRSGVGNRIYGKMLGLQTLDLDEVGIGLRELAAIQEQNTDMLGRLLEPFMQEGMPSIDVMSLSELAKLINDNDVWVATFKPPNNQGQDIQRRKLRVLTRQQRGIYLHNLMAAMYTADYDGDDMEISLDPNVTKLAKNPMDYMVDIYGNISLNMDFLPVAPIVPVNGMDEWHYVRDIMLGEFTMRDDGGHIDRRIVAPLVDAILELSRQIDDKKQSKAYGKVFREARKFADKLEKDPVNSDSLMSDVCKAIFDSMRQTRYYNTLTTIGSDVIITNDAPKPKTAGDRALYEVLDGMVTGVLPNNFQELKLMLTGYTGNVEGKNAPFRFTADVGKMAKMDERLRVGNDYQLDPNDDMQMELFFKTTVKFAASQRMAKEIKAAGRSEYYTQVMRKMVIDEVGFPNQYGSFSEFLTEFARSYNRHSAIINEANLVFTTSMGISSENNGLVSPITRSGRDENGNVTMYTLGDLAEPMLSIYGKYSVGRMFHRLVETKVMDRSKRDDFFAGNPQARKRERWQEREYDNRYDTQYFWVTGKYIDYSLSRFKTENRLLRGEKVKDEKGNRIPEIQIINNRTIRDLGRQDDVDSQFDMMMAIADKRTGAASIFNDKTFGMTGRDHRPGEKTTVRYMSTLLTSLSAALREGNEVISPGYYAGIGNRDVPKEIRPHMTDLARRLSNMNFTLRSGDAKGSDQAFQLGAGTNASIFKASSKDQVSKAAKGQVTFFDEMSDAERRAAYDSVMRLHPNGANLDERARDLHGRNYYQIMGTDGAVNSAFIACYATSKDGGTWQAIKLAHELGIPVFNAAEYEDIEQWKDDVIDAATRCNMGELRTDSVTRDQALEVEDCIKALVMANPDLFTHFNMDSPAAFLESSWGRKMLEHANDPEVLGGIYTSMVFDYRMERINALSLDLRTLSDSTRLSETWNDLMFAKDELASSSEVWRGIIRELEAENTDGIESYFQMTRRGRVRQYASDGLPYDWKAIRDGTAYFDGSHPTLLSVINDLELTREEKWNVIADVVRYWEKDAYLKSYEVGYLMESGVNSIYTIGDSVGESLLKTHNDFEQAFNRWGRKSQAMLRTDVEQAKVAYANTEGALTETIRRLDSEPWELVQIDDMMYADAVLAVYDKTYAQTEKASQNPWTNSIYAALSFQQNGGYMNDVTRTDDRLLGLTSAESVTIQDVIHLLANPGEEMTIYGRNGEWGILSRDILLANELGELTGDIEADLWRFLMREPRMASAIRRHSACVMADSDGTGFLGASNSIRETIESLHDGGRDAIKSTKYLMRDHPAYAAIISLAIPGKGAVTRNMRTRVKEAEDFLAFELYAAASSGLESTTAAEIVLGDMGITDDGLRTAMRSGFDSYLIEMGLEAYRKDGLLESDQEADDIYDYALKRVQAYIDELRDPSNGITLGQYVEDPKEFEFEVGPDATSCASFWDVIQELSGAKTAVSTGIEGSETYRFAEWVSHIHAKDKYADLQAIVSNGGFDESWNGAWTNVVTPDGGRLLVEVDTQGNVGNMRLIEEMAKEQGINEIVVQVPDGYTVRDRSTDTRGTQVASLFAYMVSKRSNGAEAFNLKAKKAGIDDKDSITKKMRGGRHRVDDDGQRTSYVKTMLNLRDIAKREGIESAKLKLAKMMLDENKELGYEDMTLANYMSIADLMLIEDMNGDVCLRSIEMLVSAIKYRIGWRIDEMSDEQLAQAVNDIVHDNSENGVGIAMMESLDGLDEFRPKSRSMSHEAIRQQSSVWKRNYDLLEEIRKNAQRRGVEPMDADEANRLNQINSAVIADVRGDSSKELFDRLNGYRIVSTVGLDKKGGMRSVAIGPSNVVYIGKYARKDDITQVYRDAYRYGMTIVCEGDAIDKLPKFVLKSAMPLGSDVMVPCFDVRLNGSEAGPHKARFAIAQVDYSHYVTSAEDSTNEFALGDAEAQALRHLTDNMSMRDGRSERISADSLFPNVFSNPDYAECRLTIGLANGDEIRNQVVDGASFTIDYGIVEGADGFEQRKHDVDKAIERYRNRWASSSLNSDGLILDECQPGDIIGWAECEIAKPDGTCQYVLSPIIPFPLHGVKRQPSRFSVENIGPADDDGTLFAVDWQNRTELTEEFVKYFDSSGGANKGMISLTQALDEERTLMNGIPLDIYIAKASTDSRKVGTDRRIKTMITLMTMARINGYNFARKKDGTPNPDAFPDNPNIRKRMLHERIPRSEWPQMLDDGLRFVTDDGLNAFLEWECRKVLEDGGNPSDYLANTFEDENGELRDTHVMWEFEAMFDQGLSYEDGLLRFLHFMDDTFCPNGIDDAETDYLFALQHEGGEMAKDYNHGVLQMRVPHAIGNGMIAYMWDNVYIGMSFFGEEYSGFSRPNVDGASNFLDGMNTMSMYGKRLDSTSARHRSEWATADIGRKPHSNGSYERM